MLCSSSASSRAQRSKFRNLSDGITPNSRTSRTLLPLNPPSSPSPDQEKRNTERYEPVDRFPSGTRWLTAQETTAPLDTTSSEVCRLLSLGRLSGTKQKDLRRAGKSQWLVDPESVLKEEKLRKAKLVRRARRLKRVSAQQ